MLKRFLTLASAGFLLSGCALSTTQLKAPPVSEAVLQPCPPLQKLADGSHQALERWAVDSAFRYRECSERQALAAEILRSQGKGEKR